MGEDDHTFRTLKQAARDLNLPYFKIQRAAKKGLIL
jgi:hypothetical protein